MKMMNFSNENACPVMIYALFILSRHCLYVKYPYRISLILSPFFIYGEAKKTILMEFDIFMTY